MNRSRLLIALICGLLGSVIVNVFATRYTPVPQSELSVAWTTAVPPTRPSASSASPVPSPAKVAVAPTLTIAPLAKATLPPGCTNPNATITSLVDNGTISGLIEINGTVARPDTQYWKVEIRPEGGTAYNNLSNSVDVVSDGVLARLSSKTLSNGVYFIRLVVVRKDGNYGTPCEFRVNIQN